MVIGYGFLCIGCPFTSISTLLRSALKRESLKSSLGLLSPSPAFLYVGALAFLVAFVLSVQIFVARIKSMTFLRASAMVVSFHSAKENFNRLFFRLFRKEVHATWWKHLTNSTRDSCDPCLILDK